MLFVASTLYIFIIIQNFFHTYFGYFSCVHAILHSYGLFFLYKDCQKLAFRSELKIWESLSVISIFRNTKVTDATAFSPPWNLEYHTSIIIIVFVCTRRLYTISTRIYTIVQTRLRLLVCISRQYMKMNIFRKFLFFWEANASEIIEDWALKWNKVAQHDGMILPTWDSIRFYVWLLLVVMLCSHRKRNVERAELIVRMNSNPFAVAEIHRHRTAFFSTLPASPLTTIECVIKIYTDYIQYAYAFTWQSTRP